jgi:hypothetical protein
MPSVAEDLGGGGGEVVQGIPMPSIAEDLGGGGCMAWRFQQQDKRQKAMSNGDW